MRTDVATVDNGTFVATFSDNLSQRLDRYRTKSHPAGRQAINAHFC